MQQVVIECPRQIDRVPGVKDTQEKNTYTFCSWRGLSSSMEETKLGGGNPHAKRGPARSLRRKGRSQGETRWWGHEEAGGAAEGCCRAQQAAIPLRIPH